MLKTTKIRSIKSYPTYQLHAESVNENVQTAFKVCILETFAWIRSRLEGFDSIPHQLDMPSAENYDRLDLDSLYSFSIDAGYTVDVVYVRSKKIWAFNMTKPDMGANIGLPNERHPVSGRTFSTDITFRMKEKSVEIAIRTICSEPSESTAECEVFRPALVKSLANNKLVGLKEHFPINGQPIEISTKSAAEKVFSYIDDYRKSLPVVFICSAGSKIVEKSEKKTFPFLYSPFALDDFPASDLVKIIPQSRQNGISFKDIKADMSAIDLELKMPLNDKKENEAVRKAEVLTEKENITEVIELENINYNKIAASALGYAYVCFVTEQCVELIGKKYDRDLKNGDIIIVTGGEVSHKYEYDQYCDDLDGFRKKLREIIYSLPRRRTFQYGTSVFHTDARLIEIEEKRAETSSLEGKSALLTEENERLKQKIKELEQLNADRSYNSGEYRKALKHSSLLEAENEKLRLTAAEITEKLNSVTNAYKASAEVINFYKQKAETAAYFPDSNADVCEWIDNTLSDLIIVAPSARSEMKKYSGEMDTAMLCDGLLFLYGYALYRRWSIDGKILQLYGEYGNWTVEKCGAEALKVYRDDYTVTVGGEKYLLDLHIKYGVIPTKLIRVYFCWDDKKKKIIIGHMPGHLATLKQGT
ncbi:MAG: hypothetical protein ACI4JK_12725 [Oscillospiraceae bacterium]